MSKFIPNLPEPLANIPGAEVVLGHVVLDSLHTVVYCRLVRLRPAKVLALFVFSCSFAVAQNMGDTPGDEGMCPLSDSRAQKSIDAFSKIAPILNEEPRCLNCHGGVNPFVEGIGDGRTEHGGGKTVENETECSGCHNTMAPKRGGVEKSHWQIPFPSMFFLGKDAPTLCAKMHEEFRGDERKFIEHFKDDVGHNNFVGTAFMGNRGLSAEDYPEIPPQPPLNIDAPGLVKLGEDWLATTDGEFQGWDAFDCGCKILRYAIRVTASTEFIKGPLHHKSALPPVDIPITFQDDGTFSGEGMANFQAAATVPKCSGQSTASLKLRVSGHLTQTFLIHDLHFKLENVSPTVTTLTGQCAPYGSFSNKSTQSEQTALPFESDHGRATETFDYAMPEIFPGFKSKMHLEIVKLAEPQK